MKSNVEKRFASVKQVRMEGGENGTPLKMIGYAAVFESLSVPLGCPEDEGGVFYEVISRGAFSESLRVSDVVALYNHDDRLVLGRTRAGTLKLWEDENGLGFECILPKTSYAADLVELAITGNQDQCSFGFNCSDEDQAVEDRGDGVPLRRINRVELVEISLGVTFPAYRETTSAIRSAAVAKWRTSRTSKGSTSAGEKPLTPRLRKALRELAIIE